MPQIASPMIPRIVLGVVAMFGLSIPTAVTMKSAAELSLLEASAQTTSGTVAAKSCQNHGNISYSYRVGGKRYDGQGFSCGMVCEDAAIGDEVRVVYSGEKPQLSRCNSLEFSKSNVTGNIVAILAGSLVLAVGIYKVTKTDEA